MLVNKKCIRIRRSIKTRKKLQRLNVCRLVVHRTLKHMYAQIISNDNCYVLVSVSTTEKLILEKLEDKKTGNKIAASMVGKVLAERAMKKGIIYVSFDRSGFKYHGRVQVLADSARQSGLRF